MKKKLARISALALSLSLMLTACGAPAGTSAPAASSAPSTSQQTPSSGVTTEAGNIASVHDPDNIVLGGRDAEGTTGVVSSGRLEASQLGVEILKNGGNAIDAAVAMGFLLGVCEQQSSGIGGGGFMLVRFADTDEVVFIDFRDKSGAAASLVPVIVEFAVETLHRSASTNMAVAGQARLLHQPEYRDIDKAQRMMTTLDEDALVNLPAVMQNANGTRVLVGPENVAEELKDTSVVMTKFDIGDGLQGMIGVVGPTRMDYAKVTARLSYFAESLSKMFAKPEQPQLPESTEEN